MAHHYFEQTWRKKIDITKPSMQIYLQEFRRFYSNRLTETDICKHLMRVNQIWNWNVPKNLLNKIIDRRMRSMTELKSKVWRLSRTYPFAVKRRNVNALPALTFLFHLNSQYGKYFEHLVSFKSIDFCTELSIENTVKWLKNKSIRKLLWFFIHLHWFSMRFFGEAINFPLHFIDTEMQHMFLLVFDVANNVSMI